MKSKFALLLLLALCTFSSCKMYKDVSVSDIQEVKMGELNSDGIEAQIYFTIENPNWYDLKLKETKVDVFIEGDFFGTIDQFGEILIPKKSKTTQALRVKAKPEAFQKLLGSAIKLFFKSELKIEAKGYARGKALFINKRIDISVSESVDKEDIGL